MDVREAIEDAGGLVSAGELAQRWMVSRQRAHQMTKTKGFPEPVGRVGRVDVYLGGEAEEWRTMHTVRP